MNQDKRSLIMGFLSLPGINGFFISSRLNNNNNNIRNAETKLGLYDPLILNENYLNALQTMGISASDFKHLYDIFHSALQNVDISTLNSNQLKDILHLEFLSKSLNPVIDEGQKIFSAGSPPEPFTRENYLREGFYAYDANLAKRLLNDEKATWLGTYDSLVTNQKFVNQVSDNSTELLNRICFLATEGFITNSMMWVGGEGGAVSTGIALEAIVEYKQERMAIYNGTSPALQENETIVKRLFSRALESSLKIFQNTFNRVGETVSKIVELIDITNPDQNLDGSRRIPYEELNFDLNLSTLSLGQIIGTVAEVQDCLIDIPIFTQNISEIEYNTTNIMGIMGPANDPQSMAIQKAAIATCTFGNAMKVVEIMNMNNMTLGPPQFYLNSTPRSSLIMPDNASIIGNISNTSVPTFPNGLLLQFNEKK